MAKDYLPGIVACADLCSGCATVVLRGRRAAANRATQEPWAWTGGAQPGQQERGEKAGCLEAVTGGYRTALWTTWCVQFEAEHS